MGMGRPVGDGSLLSFGVVSCWVDEDSVAASSTSVSGVGRTSTILLVVIDGASVAAANERSWYSIVDCTIVGNECKN
ncbi:hypothetical protein BDZ85DRAFT_267258 [Elsinoe ampelina]|uniref:Uncharacterized protein n=1 Tax=Elsinoe ampelina TaxID=302913 RepID=A0A6A6G3K5_9PEZI|nr:hypothetical protein BDZ85DRAFT_267258 [Elsinoe ampelina]